MWNLLVNLERFLSVKCMGGGTFFKVEGEHVIVKKLWKIFEVWIGHKHLKVVVTSQASKSGLKEGGRPPQKKWGGIGPCDPPVLPSIFKCTVEKGMSLNDELFKCALLFTTCPAILNTRSLAALAAITQNVFPARSLRAGNFNLWFHHHWRMLLHTCSCNTNSL